MLDGSENDPDAGDYAIFIIFNCDCRLQNVSLPALQDKKWLRVIDTSIPCGWDFLEPGSEIIVDPPGFYIVNPRSTVLLIGR
jgi:isoamylase